MLFEPLSCLALLAAALMIAAYQQLKVFVQTQLIYDLESESASLGTAYYAIWEMKELVANAVDNVAAREHAGEIKVTPHTHQSTCTSS